LHEVDTKAGLGDEGNEAPLAASPLGRGPFVAADPATSCHERRSRRRSFVDFVAWIGLRAGFV
jgi:hypothetical protein